MRALSVGLALSVCCFAVGARAQSWVAPRTSPGLGEIVAIDATGEPGWPYGAEDVAGDGLATFKQQEQSIDIRTVYASTDASRFWVRLYVSDPHTAGGNVTAFVFVDADPGAHTGGTAAAPELDSKLTVDSSPGGYDYVIEIAGSGSVDQIWQWNDTQGEYVEGAPLTSTDAVGETGQDLDPILLDQDTTLGHEHGYLQAAVQLELVGLTPACQAMLYVRSVHSAAGGEGDLEVGQVAPCIPADANGDGIPDSIVPPTVCVTSDQCPGGGICSNGVCVVPQPCVDDADCDLVEECSAQYLCVPRPAGPCTDNADCGDLVCNAAICSACVYGSEQCGPGRVCGRDGRCVDVGGTEPLAGIALTPDDIVQGGALTCAVARTRPGARHGRGGGLAWLMVGTFVAGALRRRRRGAGQGAGRA